MYEKDEDKLYIWETSLSKEALGDVLPHLFAETGTSEAEWGQMAGMMWLPESMAEENICSEGYLALTLG